MERFIFDTSSHTLVCGILNITPDSFSDGGKWDEPQKALEHALEMQALGADIIDVGAQSTRPGSTRLSADEENARLIPVLDLLKGRITVPISVDTFYPECARTALTHGAKIINDVSGEASDEMAKVVSEFGAGWIIMHNPAGADAVPVYENGSPTMCSTFSTEPRGSQNRTGYRRAASASTRESAFQKATRTTCA